MTVFNMGRDREHEAIEIMTEIVDGFTEYVSAAERTVSEGRKYRLSLLWVHAVAALLMAPAFAALGQDGMAGTAWTYLRQLPYAPLSIAALLGIGGLTLGYGCLLRNRRIEATGLILLASFYIMIGVGFTLSIFGWYTGTIDGNKPSTYAPILYLHLTIIMLVHFATLLRLIAEQKKEEGDLTG